MTAITVLGTGHMGTPIAHRLLADGHRLTVWNRTAARTAALVEARARAAATPAEAVAEADVVITMLTDADAVDAVLFGADGAATALPAGAHLVEMSTIGPGAVRALAPRLPAGVALVDAPVAGSVEAAGSGRLTVLAGGSDPAVDRVAPILAALGTVRRCGGLGSGAAMKLVLNTALVTAVAALADTLTVADAVGVDRAAALEALASGPLGGAVARGTAAGASFAIALAGKDMDLALGELGDAPAPVARATARVLHGASDQSADIATLTKDIATLTKKE